MNAFGTTDAARKELLAQREARWRKAVALERPDRVPVVLAATGFCARHLGIRMADFVNDWALQVRTVIKSLTSLGKFDAVGWAWIPPSLLPVLMLSPVKLPGRDLPDDAAWQIDERELLTPDDYDRIVEQGWGAWREAALSRHFPEMLPELERFDAFDVGAIQQWEQEGILVINDGSAIPPYVAISGARSMVPFLLDLHRIPDKVQAALDACQESVLAEIRTFASSGQVPRSLSIPGGRFTTQVISPRLWDRFVFSHTLEIVNAIAELGSVVSLHFDSDWTKDLARLREFPKAKCVLELDGATDIFKAKEVLGDHMCIQGDVPAALLALGTPDKVHAYCTRLINEVGPEGFILSQGCEIPFNAKPENVAAMLASVA